MLSQVLSKPVPQSTKLDLAVRLFEIEALALLKRSILLAGFEREDAMEGSERHILVASEIQKQERQRLEKIVHSRLDSTRRELLSSKGATLNTDGSRKRRSTLTRSRPSSTKECRSEPIPSRRRHMHRRGKCGHKAILHRPPGKPAHIDFIVGNVIECFEGIKPVGPNGEGAMWPSGFLCEEIACPEDSVTREAACGSSLCDADGAETIPKHRRPRQLSLSDIDFLGPEGSTDFFLPHGEDDVLLGLLKLCEMETVPAVEEV